MAPLVIDEEKRDVLLDRLGGEAALKGVVYDFYGRILEDRELSPFFAHADMNQLRDHQCRFMEIAFTSSIPDGAGVVASITEKHRPLFEKGLNEHHFDLVAGHLVKTLQHLQVEQPVMDEVVSVVGPLRAVFAENAVHTAKREGDEQKKAEDDPQEVLLDRMGGPAALKGAVYEFYGRILEDEQLAPFFAQADMKKLRDHQYKFMEIAFTGIPKDLDVVNYLGEKHQHLFGKGLNVKHFDLVAGHLVGTLRHLNVKPDVIDDVVATVGPLRVVFDK